MEQLERLVKETAKDEALKETLLGKSTGLEESKATLARQQERLQVSFQILYTNYVLSTFSAGVVALARVVRDGIMSLACAGLCALELADACTKDSVPGADEGSDAYVMVLAERVAHAESVTWTQHDNTCKKSIHLELSITGETDLAVEVNE